MAASEVEAVDEEAVRAVLRRQAEDPDDHDRGLIVGRLACSPQQRLDAHAAFLRFYARIRPEGPLIRD